MKTSRGYKISRRSPYLTVGMLNMLQMLLESEDGEVVYEKGGGWWIDLEQVSGRVVKSLLELCLVSERSYSETVRRYVLNSEGRQIFEDPHYVPGIIRAVRLGHSVEV